jgi:excisionase family DNA binding protein
VTSTSTRLPDFFFFVDEIAERLKVSTKTVRRWIERGDLHVHHLGRQLRVSEDDLMLFLQKRRR